MVDVTMLGQMAAHGGQVLIRTKLKINAIHRSSAFACVSSAAESMSKQSF